MTSQSPVYTDLTSKPVFTRHREGYILYFWAPWHESSAPGGATHSLFETLASSVLQDPSSSSSSSGIHCCRIEAEKYPSLCQEYNVTVVPTFVFVYSNESKRPIQKWEGVFDVTSSSSDTQSVLALTQAAQNLLEWTTTASLIQAVPSVSTVSSITTTEGGRHVNLPYLLQTASYPIVVFIKGTPTHPQSTESKNLIELLERSKLEFQSYDLVSDNTHHIHTSLLQDIHPSMTTTTTQDTFVYVHGTYVGGYDTLIEKIQNIMKNTHTKENEDTTILTLDILGLSSSSSHKEIPSMKTSPNTTTNTTTTSLEDRLHALIHQSKVMVFMKGLPSTPRCGFSRQICDILNQTHVPYGAFDILQDEAVRQGLKEYSNWPTYPQLYVKGEFIGGLDIVKEFMENDELNEILNG